MKDAVSFIKQYDYNGKLVRDIQLPGVGTAGGFVGKEKETTLYFSFTNYVTPGTTYAFDPKTGKSEVYQKPKVDFNSADYESKQVFYTSKDGTKVPMIITYKKGTKLNGQNPTILYGYGGFNVSLTPAFSIANAVWLENGGIYAVANLRGGGEYGKKWHDAGTKMQKQMGMPMVGVGLNYSVISKSEMSASPMNGEDMIMPMLTVSLPIYRKKYKAMQAETNFLKAASEQNYQATVNALLSEYYQALQQYNDAARRMKLYDNQSQLAKKSLDISIKTFSSSASGLSDILRIRQQLLDYELKQVEAVVEFNKAVALIKKITPSP